jgi:TatD DNase family protein
MQPINYFDIHSHLNFPQFDEDREVVIGKMKEQGIWTICVGTDPATSAAAVELAAQHENIFATIGIHPTDSSESFVDSQLSSLAEDLKVVAVGECGLDYFRLDTDVPSEKIRQRELFIKQIELSLDHNLPLVIHGRPQRGSMDAYEDILTILHSYAQEAGEKLRGDAHFFVGSVDIARQFLDLGFTLSFDGPVTFARDYDDVVRYVPQDRIMAETDAPFAAPAPERGRRNSPLYLPYIVQALAEIRSENVGALNQAMIANAGRLFGI